MTWQDISTAPRDGTLRCAMTGNLCGTDTWAEDYICPCEDCQTWVKQNDLTSRYPLSKRRFKLLKVRLPSPPEGR